MADPVDELAALAATETDRLGSPALGWVAAVFPTATSAGFGSHHREFWEWAWSIRFGVPTNPFVAVWPRGGGKSSSAEMMVVAVAARYHARYVVYACETQDQADKHVDSIAALLDSPTAAAAFPDVAARAVNKYGHSRGWRRNRLVCASGFVLDGIGLDTAARGVKFEDRRPDGMILDDLDGTHDTTKATAKKIDTLTKALLPALAEQGWVLAVQNLVHPDGIFARLVDGRADFLSEREVSGPVPALRDMTVDEGGLVDGAPSWTGQGVDDCRQRVATFGLSAFRQECQHDLTGSEHALWTRDQLDAGRVSDTPGLVRVTIGVDPSGGADEQGIVAAGLGADGHVYVLKDWSARLSADGWGRRVVDAWVEHQADVVAVERNYGGDMASHTIEVAARAMGVGLVNIVLVTATRGKVVRAEPVAALSGDPNDAASWGRARLHVVGQLDELEREMVTFDQSRAWSPNRLDALVWAVTELLDRPVVPAGRPVVSDVVVPTGVARRG